MKKTILSLLLLMSCLLIACDKKNSPKEEPAVINVSMPGEVYNSEEFVLSLKGDGVVKAELYVKEQLVKTIFAAPFSEKIELKDLQVGTHTLTCIAETSKGEKIQVKKEFNFKVKIGTDYQGGFIVHLYDEGQHGIIVAHEDLAGGSLAGMYYYDHGYGREGVSYDAYDENDGRNNTKLMKGYEADMAAVACRNYNGGGFSDWYLPAINEFEYIMKYEEKLMPGRVSDLYWSSTLRDPFHAKLACFGRCATSDKDHELNRYHYVRPFRRF